MHKTLFLNNAITLHAIREKRFMLSYRMKRFYYTGFPVICILLVLLFSSALAAPGTRYRITQVHDGDTVSIRVSSFARIPIKTERVRLIGVDAPELRQEPWGRLSKRYLKKLLSEYNWVANVEFDIEQRDKYGRLLAYLWGSDGRMINEQMLETGHALLFTLPPNVKYSGKLAAAQERARSKKAGLWSRGGLKESPEEWRRTHPRM